MVRSSRQRQGHGVSEGALELVINNIESIRTVTKQREER